MSEIKLPSNEELQSEMKKITVYPSGSENIGKEPIKGEDVLSQDKNSKLEKGLRIAGGVVAFAALMSLMPEETIGENGQVIIQESSNWLRDTVGVTGQILTVAAGAAIAGGKATQEIVAEIAQSSKKFVQEEGPKLKEGFIKSLANARASGAKLSKKAKSYAKRTIEGFSGKKTEEFEIYRANRDGSEGVDLSERIVTKINKKTGEIQKNTYKKDDDGNMKLSSILWDKNKGGRK